LIKQKSNKF